MAAGIALAGAVLVALFARGLAGDEEAAHYLIARYAFGQPTLFLSEVGRPLVTVALVLPAQFGLIGARLASALAAGLTALLVARTAERTGWVNPIWAALFLLVQPFYLAHAGSAMTEPWAALLIAWSVTSYADRRFGALAAAGALLPLARMETVVLWPLMAAVFWRERRLRLVAVLPAGMLLWNFAGALTNGDPLYLLHLNPRVYPAREPLLYIRSMVWILGWGLFVPVVLGTARAVAAFGRGRTPAPVAPDIANASSDRPGREGDPQPAPSADPAFGRRVLESSTLGILLAFALYTYLAVWRPLTFGNLRYLAFFAPLFALLAGAGVDAVRRSRSRVVWIGLAVAAAGSVLLWGRQVHEGSDLLQRRSWVPVLVVVGWGILAFSILRLRAAKAAPAFTSAASRLAPPMLVVALGLASLAVQHGGTLHLRPNAEQEGMQAAARLIDRDALGDRPVLSAHPLLAYFLDRNPYDPVASPPVMPSLRGAAPPGTLWFWESHYTPRPGADFGAASLEADPGWRYLGGVVSPDSTWAGAFFMKTTPGAEPPPAVVAGGAARNAWFSAAKYAEWGAGYAAQAAAADPGDAERWRILADRLATLGRLDAARQALGRAETAAPGDPRNLGLRATILLEEGHSAEAEDAARRAYEARPQDPALQFLYGRILWERDRSEKAGRLILGSLDRLADRWDAKLMAATVSLATGEEDRARQYYEAALDLNPGLVIAHFRLAQLALRRGDPGGGIRHLRAVIHLQPESARAYVLLGELYQRLQRIDEARAVWREGLTRTGGDSTLAEKLRAVAR